MSELSSTVIDAAGTVFGTERVMLELLVRPRAEGDGAKTLSPDVEQVKVAPAEVVFVSVPDGPLDWTQLYERVPPRTELVPEAVRLTPERHCAFVAVWLETDVERIGP